MHPRPILARVCRAARRVQRAKLAAQGGKPRVLCHFLKPARPAAKALRGVRVQQSTH